MLQARPGQAGPALSAEGPLKGRGLGAFLSRCKAICCRIWAKVTKFLLLDKNRKMCEPPSSPPDSVYDFGECVLSFNDLLLTMLPSLPKAAKTSAVIRE